MTPYRRTEFALSVFVLGLGLATVIAARYTIDELEVLQDTIGARGFAYVIGTLVAIGGAILVAIQFRSLRRGGAGANAQDARELGGDDPRFPASSLRAMSVFGALVIYACLLIPAGYIVATTLFIGSGTWLMGGRGLGRLLLFPLVFAVGSYVLFDTVLGVRIPDGILKPLVDAVGLG